MTFPRHALIAALLAGTALCLPQTVPAKAPPATATAAPVSIEVKDFTLANGLRAIVYTDHSAPSVYVGVRYRTGSKDEPKGRSGFAHLFEHLMFQSTANRKGDFTTPLTAAGAEDINGQTTTDWTDYHEIVPANALDLALWMESDRMNNLAGGITQQELDEQRGVVENEKRQGELHPGAKGAERFLAAYYPAGHPYAHDTIGSIEDLDKASLADVKAWFADYYGASNAVIVLAGDIDADTARAKIERYFGAVRPGKPIDRIAQWMPVFGAVRREVMYDNVTAASISRSWPISASDPRDRTLLQLAARTMAGGRGTPFHKALVEEQHLAIATSAEVSDSQLGSMFTLSVALSPGVSPDQANAAMDAVLARYLAQGPDQARLQSVITGTDTALLRLMESAPSVGSWLIGSAVDHDDPRFFLKQRDWIGQASAQDVRTIAGKWLERPYFEMQVLPNPAFHAAAQDVDRSHLPEVGPLKESVTFPPIHEMKLDNGLKIVVAERHKLPLVDVSLRFATGSQALSAGSAHLARQAFAMMSSGTATMDGPALAENLSKLGMSLTAAPGERESSVNWSTTSPHLADAFALAAQVIRHPAYPQEPIDRAHAERDHGFAAYERNPLDAADGLFNRALWGADHPRGRIDRRGEAQTVTHDALEHVHDTLILPDNATLFIVGDVTPEQARALAQHSFGDWKAGSPAPLPATPAPQSAPPRIILVDAPGAEQSSIIVGQLVGAFQPDKAAAEALVNGILGGSFDSRLNADLRTAKGWAYNFGSSLSSSATGPRVISAGGTVQTDKTVAAMQEVRRILSGIVGNDPITQAELDHEKEAQTRAIPSAIAGNNAILGAITGAASLNLPYNRSESAIQRLSAVTLDQAREVAAQTIRPDALTWVVAGDLSLIEKDIRAANLGPVEVWDVYGKRLR